MLFQPSSRLSDPAPGFRFSFSTDHSSLQVDGAVREGRSGATLTLDARAGIHPPWLTSTNELHLRQEHVALRRELCIRLPHDLRGDAFTTKQRGKRREVGVCPVLREGPARAAHCSHRDQGGAFCRGAAPNPRIVIMVQERCSYGGAHAPRAEDANWLFHDVSPGLWPLKFLSGRAPSEVINFTRRYEVRTFR